VASFWQRQLWDKDKLVTEDDEPITVIYPGRRNDDRGADFRDAVIATRFGLNKGDIEIHCKTSDWRAHRHHQDPCYNRVILHVVLRHDAGIATKLQNGREIPVLVLAKYMSMSANQTGHGGHSPIKMNMPCREIAACLTAAAIGELLDRAGEERFWGKAARFLADLAKADAGQTLYQGIMGALGYAKNKVPFLELARRLPLQKLESLMANYLSDEECLAQEQALLLGRAGLFPSLSPDECPLCDKQGTPGSNPDAMSAGDWQQFKVRPINSPVHRLVVMAHLLVGLRRQGFLQGLLHLVESAPLVQGNQALERDLLTMIRHHAGLAGTMLGRGRAAAIIVNVLLPFSFAWGLVSLQPELARKAFTLYCDYPRLETNSIEEHMKHQLGLDGKVVHSARRQQGLIHIYQNYCSEGKCPDCTLGQLKSRDNVQI
jgi:hypothetical protein